MVPRPPLLSWLLIAGVAAAVLIGVIAFRPALFGGVGGAVSACEGLTVLGTPAVINIIDPETGGSAKVLKVDVLPNCPGTFIQGTLGSAFLRSQTGFDFDSGFTITARASTESLVYPVVNDRETVFTAATTSRIDTLCTSPAPQSPGVGWALLAYSSPSCPAQAVWQKDVGVKGHLAPIPRVLFGTDLTITLEDGQATTRRVTSGETRAEWTRDNATLATATWQGNLVTGEPPPDATGVVAIHVTDTNAWKLATLAEWSNYQSALTTFRTSVWTVGPVAGAAAQLLASSAALSVPGAFTADGTGFAVTAASRMQTPVITLLIRGEFLGIVAPIGIPALAFAGIENPPYAAGNPGTLLFDVGNRGNFTAGFSLAATCSGAPLFVAQQLTIPAKGQQRLKVPFTLANPGTFSCEATLTDLTTGAGAKQAKAIMALDVQVCQPGLGQLVTPLKVQQCKADGSGWEIVLDCSAIKTQGEVQCVNVNLGCIPVTGAACPAGTVVSDPTVTSGAICKTTVTYSAPATFSGGAWSCSGAAGVTSISATSASTAPAIAGTPAPVRTLAATTPTAGAAPGGAAPPTPGFEAVFAVAGLLVVAYIVNRKKR